MGAAVIVEAVRTPIGRRGGVLSGLLITMRAGGAMSSATIIERLWSAPSRS